MFLCLSVLDLRHLSLENMNLKFKSKVLAVEYFAKYFSLLQKGGVF